MSALRHEKMMVLRVMMVLMMRRMKRDARACGDLNAIVCLMGSGRASIVDLRGGKALRVGHGC